MLVNVFLLAVAGLVIEFGKISVNLLVIVFSLLAVAAFFCFIFGTDAVIFLIIVCVVAAIDDSDYSMSLPFVIIVFLLLFSKRLFVTKPNDQPTRPVRRSWYLFGRNQNPTLNNSVPPTTSRASIARRNLRRLFRIGRNTTISNRNLSSKQQKQIEELETAHREGFLSDEDFQRKVSEINNSHL